MCCETDGALCQCRGCGAKDCWLLDKRGNRTATCQAWKARGHWWYEQGSQFCVSCQAYAEANKPKAIANEPANDGELAGPPGLPPPPPPTPPPRYVTRDDLRIVTERLDDLQADQRAAYALLKQLNDQQEVIISMIKDFRS